MQYLSAVLTSLVIAAAACGDGPLDPRVPITPVTPDTTRGPLKVSTNEVPQLFAGDTFRIVARVLDRRDSVVTNARVIFTSANTDVFTVDSAGLIRAVAGGSAALQISAHGAELLTVPVNVALLAPDAGQGVMDASGTAVCAVSTGQRVYCWGMGPWYVPQDAGLPPMKSIVFGYGRTCGIQLDDTPSCVQTALRFKTLSGHETVCGVELSGDLYCWGDGRFGQLGDGRHGEPGAGNGHFSETPVLVELPAPAVAVAVGEQHACALSIEARVYCWGNQGPWLGNGESTVAGAIPVPHKPRPVSGSARFARISAGTRETCALSVMAHAYCWGKTSGVPVLQAYDRLVDISTSASHSCGILFDGNARCWGSSDAGDFAVLTTNVKFDVVVAGGTQSCGISVSGQAYCWGSRVAGGLGDGSSLDYPTPARAASDASFASIASAGDATCALDSAGRLYCWGPNTNGQLAMGDNRDRLTPTAAPTNLRFRGLSGWGEAYNHTGRFCALDSNGAPYCWGLVDYATSIAVPTPVPTSPSFEQITIASDNACALTAAGDAYCWGNNQSYQLGTGDRIDSATPRPVAGGFKFRKIVALGDAACGITTESDIACWGQAGPALFGTATTSERCSVGIFYSEPCSSVPIRVPGTNGAVEIGGGGGLVCFTNVYGETYCWGTGYNGITNCSRGGKYPGTCIYIPERVGGAQDVRTLLKGQALDSGGRLFLVGMPLGYPASSTFMLVPVPGTLSFTAAGGGRCALTADGAAYCWGANDRGQIGNGEEPWVSTPTAVSGSLTFMRYQR